MTYVLYGLFILASLVLIIAVLLQPGKADAGALFSSSVSSTAFGPRGTQTLLAKITIGAAALFMLAALMLSLPAVTGTRSVMQTATEEPAATPQASPVATPAPAASTSPAQPATQEGTTATNTNAADANVVNGNATDGVTTSASPASSAQAKPSATRQR